MNPIGKRVLAGTVALAVAGGCTFGGWRVYQNYHGGAVNVYDRDELINSYWQEDTQTEGVVTTDQFQSEYLSDTQTVKQVEVQPGQKVKKGDVLYTYDSTLTDIDLQRKQIEVQKKELEMAEAEKQLKVIRSYRPGKPIPGSRHTYRHKGGGEKPSEEPIPVYEGLVLLDGDGLMESPFRYLWMADFSLTDDFLAAAMQGKVDCFVRFCLEGKDVILPEPDPGPAPEPEPGEESQEQPVPGDQNQEEKPIPDDDSNPSDGSQEQHPDSGDSGDQSHADQSSPSEDGNKDEEDGSGSASQSEPEPSASGDQSSETVTLSASEQMPGVEALFFLSAAGDSTQTEEDGENDPGVPSNEEASSASESVVPSEEDQYSASWLFHCQHTVSGYRYALVSMTVGGIERVVREPMPELTDKENPQMQKPYSGSGSGSYTDPGITYTAAEIASMRAEQESTVRDCDLSLRQLKVELEKLEKEMNNSAVYSALDGVVMELADPKEVTTHEPMIKVSGGGGYLVKGTVSELALGSVKPGQSVTVSDWSTGMSYVGTVKGVSDYPSNGNNWSDGNNNVSYYPFTVSVDATANLQQNSYVQLSYSAGAAEDGDSVYLLNSFIRTEGPKSYIYIAEDGKLVKRYVRTGKSIWGSYTEILGGLEEGARLAFPFGKNVREGAAVQNAGIDTLYGD